jgi:hypothetical protein
MPLPCRLRTCELNQPAAQAENCLNAFLELLA